MATVCPYLLVDPYSERHMEQQQILAKWRRELGAIAVLIQVRHSSEALVRLDAMGAELLLAQVLGLPDPRHPDER